MESENCRVCKNEIEDKVYQLRIHAIYKNYLPSDDILANYGITKDDFKFEGSGYSKYWIKDIPSCMNCFYEKLKNNDYKIECINCFNYTTRDHKGEAIHQANCKGCSKIICGLRSYAFDDDRIVFCGYCDKCCQKMKIDCICCGKKMNKRYCDAHTHGSSKNNFRCEIQHCKDCCKKEHICMICNGINDERFKFDWKGTFHPGCLKKKGMKLQCVKCMKSYAPKTFYDGMFGEKICAKCINCIKCGKNYSKFNNCYTLNNYRKRGEMKCYDCLEEERVCVECGKKNDLERWKGSDMCSSCSGK